jgi:hypothetical protein
MRPDRPLIGDRYTRLGPDTIAAAGHGRVGDLELIFSTHSRAGSGEILGRPQFYCSDGQLATSSATARPELGGGRTQLKHFSALCDIGVKQAIPIFKNGRDVKPRRRP